MAQLVHEADYQASESASEQPSGSAEGRPSVTLTVAEMPQPSPPMAEAFSYWAYFRHFPIPVPPAIFEMSQNVPNILGHLSPVNRPAHCYAVNVT